jgi:hypothetical protein
MRERDVNAWAEKRVSSFLTVAMMMYAAKVANGAR